MTVHFNNPQYAKGDLTDDFEIANGLEMSCEKWAAMTFLTTDLSEVTESQIFSVGIKTITHNRRGLEIIPHKVVVIEMKQGDEIASFDFNPSSAKHLAKRLAEYADFIEHQGGKS